MKPHTSNGTQHLGSKVGSFDIHCTLLGVQAEQQWRPRWLVGNSRVKGVLYFQLQFSRLKRATLDNAEVKMSFGDEINEEPVPTVDRYEPDA
jgi:hypothetical protein